MAPITKNEKKLPLLPTIVINRFEKSCGTFRRGGGKNSLWLMKVNQLENKNKNDLIEKEQQ